MSFATRRVSILLLEDNNLDAELVEARLAASDLQFDLTLAEGRDSFFRQFENHSFDVVLADYSLPDFDGLTALEIVRARFARLPFIFVSGALGEEIAIEALIHGATDYVLKHRLDRLVPAVKRALSEHADYLSREAAEQKIHQIQASLEEDARRQAVMLRLLEQQRNTTDPNGMLLFAAQEIGRYLNVARVGFYEMPAPDIINFTTSWTSGDLPELRGLHSVSILGPQITQAARAGIGTAIGDVLKDDAALEASFGALGIRSYIGVPVTRNGTWTFGLYAHHTEPRVWSEGAINLCREVADFTWDSVDRQRAREALHASEERATRILQSIGDAVIVTDAAMLVSRMNPVAEDLTGWSQLQAQGQPLDKVLILIAEGTREPLESPASQVRRTNTVVGLTNHTVLVSRHGKETQIDDSAAPIRDDDGTLTGIVMVFRDIEERRSTERQRDAVTERLDQVLSVVSDAIISVDREWTMTFANPQATKVYGQVVGRNVWEMFPDANFEGSPFVECYYAAMNRGIPGDFEAYYPAPLDVWLHIMVYPTRDGIVTYSRDITQQRQSQAALIQSEKLAAVGRLASSIAHEINNPLESVTNLLYLAAGADNLGDVKEYLTLAERELLRVAAISSQTLRFHKQSSNPTPLDTEEAIDGVLYFQHGRVVNGNITVLRRFRSTRPILCFEGEIRQVLINLIGNAIDALQTGGGDLFLRTREGHNWSTGDPGVIMTIADTAGGMPDKVLKRIMEPFFTTKGEAGTGLGLWVSSEIIKRHRGRLQVRSRTGTAVHGTVFALFLPFAATKR